jgi:AcrR family transcriptional regulator
MGRRSRADGDRTRERILDVALPLFAERGYAGASIRTIAKAADVNVATLAYHFDDKDGLYVTVCQRLHEDLARDFPDVKLGSNPVETVHGIIEQAWTFISAHRLHIQLLMRNVLDEGQHRDAILETWSEPLIGKALAIVRLLRPDRSDVENRLLILTLMHTMARMVVENPGQHARMLGVEPSQAERHTVSWLQGLACRELGLA